MAHNGKLKLSDYPNFSDLPDDQKDRIRKSIAKRQRRWDREHKKKETDWGPDVGKEIIP